MFSNKNQSVIEGGNKNASSKKTTLKKEKYIDTLYEADFIKNYFSQHFYLLVVYTIADKINYIIYNSSWLK